MKISIITATKNNKEGLLRAIECVRNQTYKNVEHVIVDGGSTDGSIDSINNLQLKIKNLVFISEPDEGIYDAINKGIKLSSGDVIGLLHSDDLYADEKVIEKYAECFSSDSGQAGMTGQIDAVYSDLVYVRKKLEDRSKAVESKNHTIIQSYIHSSQDYSVIRYWKAHTKIMDSGSRSGMTMSSYPSLITDNLLRNGWMPPHPTLFIRKEIFKKIGLYRIDMKIAADYEMILRLLYKYKITAYYLPFTSYYMHLGGASNKSLGNIFLKSKEDYKAMKLNEIPSPFLTLFSKNIRKLPQFLAR